MLEAPPFRSSTATFIQTPRRIQLLDILLRAESIANAGANSPRSAADDAAFDFNNVHRVEANILRHSLQAVFAYLDGEIDDIKDVLEMIDEKRAWWKEWIETKRVSRCGSLMPRSTSKISLVNYGCRYIMKVSYPNAPATSASAIPSDAHVIHSTLSAPSDTANRVETSVQTDTPLPLPRHSMDRAGTNRKHINIAVSTPLRVSTTLTAVPLSPTVIVRHPLGPQDVPRWNCA